MKKIVLFVVAIMVLLVISSGCTNNNTSNQSSNVTIKINSNSTWGGEYAYKDGNSLINGTGNASYDLGPNPGDVTVTVQENVTSTGPLTVQLLQGETVVETQTNSSDYPVVTISHKF
ncbi:hypothetical protein [Methanobacterium petrolearium]|uniref:hypothetical protein n=1 Tax=Methanobacterium petrolearium TaxID=710190 RepID=UPI001AEA51E0|nr:hypothetical protein [Methanobacterium petrolearium]MBP1945956.1 uncharacterized protein YxeA [Methanobacterium petrolearium]BDZ72226.1 hypothetical protein GCM10025861_27430 [Methanobacterium petrolearium]